MPTIAIFLSVSPGNVMTPLWKEFAQSTDNLQAAIQEGEEAQVKSRIHYQNKFSHWICSLNVMVCILFGQNSVVITDMQTLFVVYSCLVEWVRWKRVGKFVCFLQPRLHSLLE